MEIGQYMRTPELQQESAPIEENIPETLKLKLVAALPREPWLLTLLRRVDATEWGLLPPLVCLGGLTLAIVAIAGNVSRANGNDSVALAEALFWYSTSILFVPCALRLILPTTPRRERLGIVVLFGLVLDLIPRLFNPLSFTGHDEFIHLRTATDIANAGRLFIANPLIPVSPRYPGLEIVTQQLSHLSGLSLYGAGVVLLIIVRVLLLLALFLIFERASASTHFAGIATLIYLTDPHLLFFDSSFSYESLALPLGAVVVLLALGMAADSRTRRHLLGLGIIVLLALAVTHHATSYLVIVFLLVWGSVAFIIGRADSRRSQPILLALLGVGFAVYWAIFFAQPIFAYLVPFISSSVVQITQILSGHGGQRQLFTDYAGEVEPLWHRLCITAAVGMLSLSVPVGLWIIWKRQRTHVFAVTLGIVALLYPASQVLRLSPIGAEATDRLGSFLYVALGWTMALIILHLLSRLRTPLQTLLGHGAILAALLVLFLGGMMLGADPSWALLPGPYLVSADPRSVEPEGIQTSTWALKYLGPNNLFFADRTNRLLLASNGSQIVYTHLNGGLDLSILYLSAALTPEDLHYLQTSHVQYLVVDMRLSQQLPRLGVYFEEGEDGAYEHATPIPIQDLTKFDAAPNLQRIYDSGDIRIYKVVWPTVTSPAGK